MTKKATLDALYKKALKKVTAKKPVKANRKLHGVFGVKTREIKIYSFEELPTERAKETARDWYRSSALNDKWWDGIFEDAANISLEITGFDIERRPHAEGRFKKDATDVAKAIIENHGEETETYKDAKALLKEWNEADKKFKKELDEDGYDEHGNENFKDTEEAEKIEAEFEETLLQDYAHMLRGEYEFMMSDEQIDESIIINEHEFLEDGSRA